MKMMITLSNVIFEIDEFILTVKISHQKYEKMKKDPLTWYCANCTTKIPFTALSKKDLKYFLYSTTTPQPSQISQKPSKKI